MDKPERLQRTFELIAYLFNWVDLQKNTRKMASMSFQPFYTPRNMSVVVYSRRAKGTSSMYWERQGIKFQCPEFRVEVALGSLMNHRQSQNGMVQGYQRRVTHLLLP